MNECKLTCLNGDVKAGDIVITSKDSDFANLIGRVIYITKLGTQEHEDEAQNDTDNIHVDFERFEYSDSRKPELNAMLTDLYNEPKKFDNWGGDDVIMAPDDLVKVTGIDEDVLRKIAESDRDTEIFTDALMLSWKLSQPSPTNREQNICQHCGADMRTAQNNGISIIRNGERLSVKFEELRDGDIVHSHGYQFTCVGDAHESGDASYEGYLVYSETDSYFPEDFGGQCS